jgi:hypothetical protein
MLDVGGAGVIWYVMPKFDAISSSNSRLVMGAWL